MTSTWSYTCPSILLKPLTTSRGCGRKKVIEIFE
jgi:hypothetical protein